MVGVAEGRPSAVARACASGYPRDRMPATAASRPDRNARLAPRPNGLNRLHDRKSAGAASSAILGPCRAVESALRPVRSYGEALEGARASAAARGDFAAEGRGADDLPNSERAQRWYAPRNTAFRRPEPFVSTAQHGRMVASTPSWREREARAADRQGLPPAGEVLASTSRTSARRGRRRDRRCREAGRGGRVLPPRGAALPRPPSTQAMAQRSLGRAMKPVGSARRGAPDAARRPRTRSGGCPGSRAWMPTRCGRSGRRRCGP